MSIYEEVEFEDLDYDPVTQIYTYPCPCGDKFSISLEALWDGEDIATCPSCTLRIEIIYDEEDLPPLRDDDDDESGGEEEEEEEEGEKKKQDEKGEEKKEEIDHNIASVLQKSLTVK
ncbi:putative diphthamide biosynthesis protein 3 [Skeletonema marinoi]|uniref:Diphthamide biosynthesis protein 3 n=1 Tax=Skeletonema marinoi TaxID=267567 RepID=A0AAD9D7D8_9STRA|nr:putative diphthamide biosynthesis protein 3 [Skeletonema marinoi]